MQVASATASGIVGNAIEPMPMPMPMSGTMQQARCNTYDLAEKNLPFHSWLIVVLTTPAGARQKKCGGTAVVPGKKKRREGVLFFSGSWLGQSVLCSCGLSTLINSIPTPHGDMPTWGELVIRERERELSLGSSSTQARTCWF